MTVEANRKWGTWLFPFFLRQKFCFVHDLNVGQNSLSATQIQTSYRIQTASIKGSCHTFCCSKNQHQEFWPPSLKLTLTLTSSSSPRNKCKLSFCFIEGSMCSTGGPIFHPMICVHIVLRVLRTNE